MSLKKYFCCADVHSFYNEMMEALNTAGFDKDNEDHIFVHCGDLLDRGPDARKCLQFVNSLERKILIKGNHEALLEDILFRKWGFDYYDVYNGTRNTVYQIAELESGHDVAAIQRCLDDQDLYKYLRSLQNFEEVGDYIFVHGWIPAEETWKRNDWRWGNWKDAAWLNGMYEWSIGHKISGKTIVCGHWKTSYAHMKFNGKYSDDAYINEGIIALDATTVLSGQVNVVTLEI